MDSNGLRVSDTMLSPPFLICMAVTLENFYSERQRAVFLNSIGKSEFGASIRITIPPYPTDIRIPKLKGVPIKGLDTDSDDELRKTFMYDVMVEGNELVTAGINGFICAPIVTSHMPGFALDNLEKRIEKIQIPDKQHRTDLKESILKRYLNLQRMNWI